MEDPDWLVVDTRAASELIKLGKIKGAVHAPRQSIEFHVDPEMEGLHSFRCCCCCVHTAPRRKGRK